MKTAKKLMFNYRLWRFRLYRLCAAWRQRQRLLFPSPAEIEFIRIFGGKYHSTSFIRHPMTGFALTWITTLGPELERERMQREVRAGAMYIDFGVITPYFKRGIEIDGKNFHRDIVKERQRDNYCRKFGWHLLHITAEALYKEPELVRREVLEWLAKPLTEK